MTPEENWRERELASLAAIASSLDLIACTLGAMYAASVRPDPDACAHTDQQDLGSTMGHPRWRCKQCGYEVNT